ncbi:MAG: M28 family metallopeptidase [Pseudomarimonas sp.]
MRLLLALPLLVLTTMPLAPAALAANAQSAAWPAVSYDTRYFSAAKLESLKAEVNAGFWLETGDALLVAAPAEVQSRIAQSASIVDRHGPLAINDLVTVPIGCDMDADERPDALAVMGRHALVRASAIPHLGHHEAKQVLANSVLAREFRPAPGLARAADPAIDAVVALVDTARWFSRVETLAGFDRSSYGAATSGSEMNQARDWLAATFEGLGMATTTPTFSSGSVIAENVIAFRPGTRIPEEWIVIGGHYDSRNTNNSSSGVLNTPGAEDNASGCAGVLEMASIFANVATERSLVFACYAGEEQGLLGSLDHAQDLADSGDLVRVKLAVMMDMIGYSGDTDFDILLESGNTPTQLSVLNTFAQLATDYAPGSRTIIDTSPCCSDHMPWIDRGVPALLTIENDWSSYAHYHRSTDLPQNMTNAQPMAEKILRTNVAAIATWAGIDSVVFTNGFE